MKKIDLSTRLKVIFNFAKDTREIADVGCDHGKISVSLAKEGTQVHAIDISNDSLEKTKVLSREHNVSNQINCYCSDGLEDVKNINLDAIIMAGMGELTLIHIITSNMECAKKAKKLILQPMDGTRKIRKYLCCNSFQIADEKLVWDEGRLYTIIVARKSDDCKLTHVEMILGPKIISKPDELLDDLIGKEINIREKILDGLKRAKNIDKKEIETIDKEIEMIRGVKK